MERCQITQRIKTMTKTYGCTSISGGTYKILYMIKIVRRINKYLLRKVDHLLLVKFESLKEIDDLLKNPVSRFKQK